MTFTPVVIEPVMFELSSCAKAAKRDNYGKFDYILTDNTAEMTEFANKRT